MPRPAARTKGASRRLATRSAASTSEPDPVPVVAVAPTNKPENPSSDIYGVSDRELKRRRSTRKSAAPSTTTTNAQQAGAALEGARLRRDKAMERLGDLTSTTGTDGMRQTSEQPTSPAADAGQRGQLANTTRRRIPDASGLDVMDDDEMFGDMDTSFDDQDLDSPPAAHNSTDTSSFNVAIFKRGRRPRTSSIVGRDDGPIRPSSRGPNTPGLSSTFSLGMFKRRQREPSILGTARKQRGRSQSVTSAAQSEDEGAFAPDAEGTPVDRSRLRTSASAARDEGEASSSPAARSRKRKSTESQESASKRRAAEAQEEQQDANHDDEDVRDSIELSSPPPSDEIDEPQRRLGTPALDDEIFAPPASSDSEAGSPSVWPSLKSLGKGYRNKRAASRTQKTPAHDDIDSDISSPPSLTHSPNYPTRAGRGRNASRKREPSPITTADLAALLPRRRRRADNSADPFDIDSEEEEQNNAGAGNDDDELSHLDARRARQHQRKQVRPLGPSLPGAEQSRSTSKPTSKPARRKYGSRNFSDKENHNAADEEEEEQEEEGDSIEVAMSPLPDDTFDSPEDVDETTQLELAEELVTAAKKFKEVDKWELDFEEVSEVSSPTNAR